MTRVASSRYTPGCLSVTLPGIRETRLLILTAAKRDHVA